MIWIENGAIIAAGNPEKKICSELIEKMMQN